jgi:mRNA-degrading endonuclease RelE of RelBE toxin-antitoxin system
MEGAYRIYTTPSARKETKKLPKLVKDAVLEASRTLERDPFAGERLTGSLHMLYSFHFTEGQAEYRMVYSLDHPHQLVIVHLDPHPREFLPEAKAAVQMSIRSTSSSEISSPRGRSWGSGSGNNVATAAGSGFQTIPTEGWFGGDTVTSNSTFDSSTSSQTFSESESETETIVPVFVPIPVQELGSESEWSREEKLSRVAEMLKFQQQRHCFIKIDSEKTQPLKVPLVAAYGVSSEGMVEYQNDIYKRQGARPGAEIDERLSE